jgi:hypothetical protein
MKNGTGPMAKIKFPSAKAEGQGVMELARRVRVIIVGEGDTNFRFVPTKSLAALKAQDIPFEVVEYGGFDAAIQALRGATSRKMQRRQSRSKR